MSTVGVVLGSGLSAFGSSLQEYRETFYRDMVGWPPCTASGHAGKLITGRVGQTEVVVLSGRAHYYEGLSGADVTHGIRELARRGVKSLILTNAAGAIDTQLQPGDLVLVSDHINLMGRNPLSGPNDDSLGPRFPDMTEAYSRDHREIAQRAGKELGIDLKEAVYAGLLGPSYETPAEIRFLRAIGAGLVGMSTVPEAIVANYLGMKVLAISCVTNMAAGILPQKLAHQEVLDTGERVRDTLIALLQKIIPRLA